MIKKKKGTGAGPFWTSVFERHILKKNNDNKKDTCVSHYLCENKKKERVLGPFGPVYSKDTFDPWDDMLLQVSNWTMDPKGLF